MMSAAPTAGMPAEFLRFAVAEAVGFGVGQALLGRLASFANAPVATGLVQPGQSVGQAPSFVFRPKG